MFMDLTILANIGQIRQSKISLADFVDFDAFFPFSLRQAFLDISKSLSAVMLSSLVRRLRNIFLLDNEVKLEKKKIQSVRKETFLSGEVEQIRVLLYALLRALVDRRIKPKQLSLESHFSETHISRSGTKRTTY